MPRPNDLRNCQGGPSDEAGARFDRRQFCAGVSGGVYAAALAWLSQHDLSGPGALQAGEAPSDDVKPRAPHFAPRAKSVIHLFMNGGPSQMDLFDPKPALERHHGQPYFSKIAGEVENPQSAGNLMRSPFPCAQHGQSGMWVSSALPHLAQQVDDLALLRAMHTTNLTHEPAVYLMQTGRMMPGGPTLGAWVVYALGSEDQNLPAYVVLDDPLGLPINGAENWHAGFLPPQFQGTRFRSVGTPVLNLRSDIERPPEIVRTARRVLAELDRRHQAARPGQPELNARIATYELAARMQLEATDTLDLSQESQATLDLYGIGREPTDSYGRRCLIARRLIERGVRFVQLYINAQIWDHHTDLAKGLKTACERTDRPIAGLLCDLKQRGLFDQTLVVWGGEFGRLPIAQLPPDKNELTAGRDHNKNAFCTWMSGAGIRGGTTFGGTDELGFMAVEGRVSVPDWHATILHLLGLSHEQIYVEQNGLKEKLTGVHEARVVREILA